MWRIYRVEIRPGALPLDPAGASGPRPASWKGSKGSALGGVQGRSPFGPSAPGEAGLLFGEEGAGGVVEILGFDEAVGLALF